jgi:hypothetical protein
MAVISVQNTSVVAASNTAKYSHFTMTTIQQKKITAFKNFI